MNTIFIIIGLWLLYYIIKNISNLIAVAAKYKYAIGDADSSLRIYKIASKFGKMNFANRLRYAYLTLREGYIDEANKLFNLIAMDKLKPNERAKLKESHALAVWKMGQIDDAIEMLEYVHNSYKSTTTYGSLGFMYIHSGNLEKALEYNLEGYEYNSDDGIIVDNLAYTYLKLKDYENAEKYYNKLLELDPRFPDGYFEYGRYLIDVKNEREKGIELVKKALDCRFSFLSMFTRRDVLDYLEHCGEDITALV